MTVLALGTLGTMMLLVTACAHEPTAQTASAPPPPPPVEAVPAPASETPNSPAMENGPTSADVPREGPNAGNDTGSGGGTMEPQSAPSMSDGQILEVTHIANTGEIAQAKLALAKARDARVRGFAQMMVRDHGQADKTGISLAKKENIELEPSATSEQLAADATSASTSLKADPAAEFDKSYVDTQVKEHQAVLDMLDQKLIVSATNPELKAYLNEVRIAVASHLQHAKDLQSQIAQR
jgi:putative membrane protein